jgi:hypothetical protein
VIDSFKLTSPATGFIPDAMRIVNRNEYRFWKGYAAYASEFSTGMIIEMKG